MSQDVPGYARTVLDSDVLYKKVTSLFGLLPI
jgi:hypothetical protein